MWRDLNDRGRIKPMEVCVVKFWRIEKPAWRQARPPSHFQLDLQVLVEHALKKTCGLDVGDRAKSIPYHVYCSADHTRSPTQRPYYRRTVKREHHESNIEDWQIHICDCKVFGLEGIAGPEKIQTGKPP